MMQNVNDNDNSSVGSFEPDEEDEEEDDEDDVGDIVQIQKTGGPNASRRRVSVSAESIDPSRVKEMIAQVVVVPKDADTLRMLTVLVNKSQMLKQMLDPEERALIVKAFSGPVKKPAGVDIIRQGDAGDLFYLLEKGTVEVFVKKRNPDGSQGEAVKVATYEEGDTFGQLALLYNAPRAATCTAKTDCVVWTLDRASFKAIIMGATIRKRDQYAAFLNNVPILSTMNEFEKLSLADALNEEKFDDGKIVCHEGDAGDNFYIVLDGVAECYQTQSGGAAKMVGRLTAGQYFGEIALLTTKPRQATVKAKGPLRALWVDRYTFNRVFGSLESVLQRNMEAYKQFTQE